MPGGAAECLVIANPQDINFQQIAQRFTDFRSMAN
jgi:hypothetical protein